MRLNNKAEAKEKLFSIESEPFVMTIVVAVIVMAEA
jgi:hypothetical protein